MQVRVLGSFELVVDGEARPVPGQGERALLALLASDPGRTITADRLIDDLWGEELPADPANALQGRVSKLRKVIGPALVTQRPGYRLEIEADQVDAVRFTRLVQEHRYEEALALWRSEPFGEFADHEWARAECARLRELRAIAVEAHLEARLAAGEHADLVPELTAAIAADPLRERLIGQLIRALHRSGRSPEALATYREYRHRLDETLGLTPSAELAGLEAAIVRRDTGLEPRRGRSHVAPTLPAPLSSLVGRHSELQQIAELSARARLVTLVGPGGVGKTRLAIAAADAAADDHPDGAWFVPLANLKDPDDLAAAIAAALCLSGPDDSPPERQVAAWLASRQALLVVDNCEHIVDAAADLAERLLGAAPHLRILATSREALGVPGEIQMPVPSLPVSDAVLLFAERARSVRPDFALDGVEAVVRRICDRLDCMPLAVELAAARLQTLPLGEIAARLDDRFGLLTRGPRTAEARHQTLRAAVDWSHQLLTGAEQALLRRLAVFQGGWTLEAAEAVGGGMGSDDVLDELSRLVEQSLVVADNGRFRLLDTIRVYAEMRLDEAGELGTMQERHARYYTALAERAEQALRGPQQRLWLARLRADDANLRRALEWAREPAHGTPELALRLAGALGWYWYVAGRGDARRQLTTTLAAAGDGSAALRARVLQAVSLVTRPAGCIVHPNAEAAEAARQSLALLSPQDEPARAALSQLLAAVEGVAASDAATYLSEVDAARTSLRSHGERWGVALADFVEMEILLHHSCVDEALAFGERACAQFDALGDEWGRSAVRLHLGFGLRLDGRVDEAVAVLGTASSISQEAGLPYNLARSLIELGEAELHRGRTEEAESWFDQAEPFAQDGGSTSLLALAALGRGDAARWGRDLEAAHQHYHEALDMAADMPASAVRAKAGLAAVALDNGAGRSVEVQLQETLREAEASGDAGVTAFVLEQLARCAAAAGNSAEGVRRLGEADAIRARCRRPRGVQETRDAVAVRTSV